VSDYQHTVKTPGPFELPPPTLRPAARPTLRDRLVLYVVRPLWAWRVELALAGLPLLVWWWLAAHLARVSAGLVVAGLVGVVVAIPRFRTAIGALLYRSRVRRRFAVACRHAELATPNDRVPRVVGFERVPAGELLRVRIPAGSTTTALAEAAEQLAVVLDVREVRVTRDKQHAALAQVEIVRRDPLSHREPLGWPWTMAVRCSLWQPIPVGIDEHGGWVTISLLERNLLLGGEPGAGKSGVLALLLAVAALDPTAVLYLFDGKLIELACWAGCARRTVGLDMAEAIGVLRELHGELDRRLLVLLANRRRKITPDLGLPLLVVAIDELAFYVAGPDRKASTEFAGLLRDLVARGRAAGIIVVAATQKPSSDVIPTSLRDLFGFRWALRCLTPQASDTILGAGWAGLGTSAATIDAADRGLGFLLHEGGTPIRLRACWLDDPSLLSLATKAELLRARHQPNTSHDDGEGRGGGYDGYGGYEEHGGHGSA
jgi:hypothetical protein